MKITINSKVKNTTGALAILLFREELNNLSSYPDFVKEFIKNRMKKNEFEGKRGEMISTYTNQKNYPERLIIISLGEKIKYSRKKAREMGGRLGKFLKSDKKTILSLMADENKLEFLPEFVEGILLSQYKIEKYKTCKKQKCENYELQYLEVVTSKSSKQLEADLRKMDLIASAVHYVKDLVNGPGNIVNANFIENEVRKISKENGYKMVILKQKELKELGWGGLLAVNQGSANEAKCCVLEYDGGKSSDPKIAIVGKGITFDSGGYHLKPMKFIETMQQDMAGCAVVLGLFNLLKKFGIKKNVVGIMPIAENLINENAYRPADIIKMFNGTTVEVTNTDAEGRLILADAVTYATKLKPKNIITIATLTGAVLIALGNRYAGLMGNDLKLIKDIQKAGNQVDELAWMLPVHRDYKKKLESNVADIMNCNLSYRGAMAQEGAAFIEYFVEKYPWCHIDIGGTAFTDEPKEYDQRGATAYGLRMLLKFLEN